MCWLDNDVESIKLLDWCLSVTIWYGSNGDDDSIILPLLVA